MMQDVGRRYVRMINNVHGRTGTLWEGRFRSSLVCDERYLMNLHRYIERNPIRAGLARRPGDYPWSSYGHYSGNGANSLITEHAAFRALAPSAAKRQALFRELFTEDLDTETLKKIREAIDADSPIGAEIRKRGRPRKEKQGDEPPPVISGKLF
jgi:putative transposase